MHASTILYARIGREVASNGVYKFVRLEDKVFTSAVAKVAEFSENGANDDGGIQAAFYKCERSKRCRGTFSMSTRNGNSFILLSDLGDRIGIGKNTFMPPPGLNNFGVVDGDGLAYHHECIARHITFFMTDRNLYAFTLKLVSNITFYPI